MTLAEASIGDEVEVLGYTLSTPPVCRAKLLALGITKKTVVEVMNIAPFGDPIEVKVRGYHLSLRLEEAKCIKVKKMNR